MINKLPKDADYEISTTLSIDSLSAKDMQEILNKISTHSKRLPIKTSDYDNEFVIKKATRQNLEDADSVLGNINAITDKITIRIYDGTDSQVNEIGKNFDVINIRKF